MKEKKSNIKIFENKKVLSQYDADKEMWYFSIVDIVGILTEQPPVLADVSSVSIRTIEPKATLILKKTPNGRLLI